MIINMYLVCKFILEPIILFCEKFNHENMYKVLIICVNKIYSSLKFLDISFRCYVCIECILLLFNINLKYKTESRVNIAILL